MQERDNCFMNVVVVIQVILCCVLWMICSLVKNITVARTLFFWMITTVLIMAGMIWGTLREYKVADFRNRETRLMIIKAATTLIATVIVIYMCVIKLFFKIS